MHGYVSEDLCPRIEDFFVIGHDTDIEIEPILDTGFNGEFCLPKRYQTMCVLQYLGTVGYLLADGTLTHTDTYIGQVIVDNQPRFVEVGITEGEDALVGMKMIQNRVATFDLRQNRVTVE